jgi:dihydrofolate reductase
MQIIAIAAVAEDRALGKNNDLLWHLPNDFKRFKQLTTGHYIIMGRKTLESFPKLLPNRTHLVVSRQKNYQPEGVLVVANLQEALEQCKGQEKVYVIGGGQIYHQSLPLCTHLEITLVHAHFPDAEVHFPEINESQWKLTFKEFHPKDDKHAYDFTYLTYERIV